MDGIMPDPEAFDGTHAGPTRAFHLPTRTFIPPTAQEDAVGGMNGVYKAVSLLGNRPRGASVRSRPGNAWCCRRIGDA